MKARAIAAWKQLRFISLIPVFFIGVIILCFGEVIAKVGQLIVDLCSYLSPIEPPAKGKK